jgi:DNA-binding LacI/PurR family transcriptional regulator
MALPEPPTAVFCYNDMTAIGLIDAARAAGVALPEELAVVGFDDIVFARFVWPPLTTVAQPMAELGRGAMEMVLSLLSEDVRDQESVTDVMVKGHLVVRASSG